MSAEENRRRGIEEIKRALERSGDPPTYAFVALIRPPWVPRLAYHALSQMQIDDPAEFVSALGNPRLRRHMNTDNINNFLEQNRLSIADALSAVFPNASPQQLQTATDAFNNLGIGEQRHTVGMAEGSNELSGVLAALGENRTLGEFLGEVKALKPSGLFNLSRRAVNNALCNLPLPRTAAGWHSLLQNRDISENIDTKAVQKLCSNEEFIRAACRSQQRV